MKGGTDGRYTGIVKAFGAILDRERRRRGLSLEILAKRAGISRQHMEVLVRGGQEPKLGTYLRVAAAVGVEPTWLLEEIVSHARVTALGGLTEPTAVRDTRMRAIGQALADTLLTCVEQDRAASAVVGARMSSQLARRGLTVVTIPVS